MDETGDVTNVAGVDLDVPAAPGIAAAPVSEVRARLVAISGLGIETRDEADGVTIEWSAGLRGLGANTGLIISHVYRAMRVTFEEDQPIANGLCVEREAEFELGGSSFLTGNWHSGQWVGGESLNVGKWMGPHSTSGAAVETDIGYEFDWSQLRDPVIAAVTGAGWTYHPEQV